MRHFSKDKLMAFRQCPKRLWLEVHRPELREDLKGTQARFKAGHQVGDMAQILYDPDRSGDVIDLNAEGYHGASAHSAELLKNSTQPIFEAGFKAAGALAFADVVLNEVENEQQAWRMPSGAACKIAVTSFSTRPAENVDRLTPDGYKGRSVSRN